jgi:putative CocE/NonD family hydrolase
MKRRLDEDKLDHGSYESKIFFKDNLNFEFKSFLTSSFHIPMRDGVKIAVDLHLPEGLRPTRKIPTLLIQTRYWRAYDIRAPFKWIQKTDEFQKFFTGHGYALVQVDVRGTGASSGTRPFPWSIDEIKDGNDIVNWIITQPWSNGKVGAIGTSYLGATAEFLAVNNNTAVKAVIPRFSQFDLYTYVPFPGGIFNEWFIREWAYLGNLLDNNKAQEMINNILQLLQEKEVSLGRELPKGFSLYPKVNELKIGRLAVRGVKPVDIDKNRSLLRKAIKEHEKNGNVYKLTQGYTHRDDTVVENGLEYSIDAISIHSFREEIERSKVGIYSWGSWLDAATADAVINRFLTYDNPQWAIIGPWNHGAIFHASPYKPMNAAVDPSETEQWSDCLRYFDHYLKDVEDNEIAKKVLIFYTLGEEKWKSTKKWPPPDSVTQRWYLSEDNSLLLKTPDKESGYDKYTIDFSTTTGLTNRWHTQLGFAVVYLDRSEEDKHLLTYTSPRLEENMEITGHPKITLYISSTTSDGAFYVYLEDVDESGRVTYVTEGQLRAIHRKITKEPAPYQTTNPYRSFKSRDSEPLIPGEITELTFNLLPTSTLIRKNHRIRIAIAGHDKDTFKRIPADDTPTISIYRNLNKASYIDIPYVSALP